MTAPSLKTTAIRAPTEETDNHTIVLRQLKEAIELAQRLRGDPGSSFVRVNELVSAGLIRFNSGNVLPPNSDSALAGGTPSSRKIVGENSIDGGGDLTADRTFELVNDTATPGANKVYGTNGSGIRGWYTGGGGGGSSPLTTKGDVYTFSSSDARLPVGADGTVLSADSTQATGLKWSASAGGSPWTQNINDACSALTNFTSISGTWVIDTGTIMMDEPAATSRFLAYNIAPDPGHGVYEVEIFIDTNYGNGYAGFFIDANSSVSNGIAAYLLDLTKVGADHLGTGGYATVNLTTATGVWYTFRVVKFGNVLTFYLDGTQVAFVEVSSPVSDIAPITGFFARQIKAHFRNFKQWSLSPP